MFTTLFGLAVCHTVLVQGQQRLDSLDTKLADAEAEYQKLRLEVAQLESPDRIVAEAARIGLVPPPGITYLTPSGAVQAEVAEATDAPPEPEVTAETAEEATGWASMKAFLDAPTP